MVVIYFSGTGNSRFAANYFAKSMECDCYSIEQELDFDAIMASNHTLAFFILYTVQVIYARHLNMPNNICNLSFLPVKNHPDIDKQIEKVKRVIEKDVQAIRTKHIRRQGFNPISKYLGFLTQRSYLGPLEEKAQKANVHSVIAVLTDVQMALLQCLFMAKLSANIKVYNE